MPFAIQPGQTVLFTGDSITDCGRRGDDRPLGAGYVRMAVDLINARYPDNGCRFINTGIGGNIVRDLFDRWTDDCIRHQPDWLSHHDRHQRPPPLALRRAGPLRRRRLRGPLPPDPHPRPRGDEAPAWC